MISAAIMQPTYLPWLGYFAMMAEAQVFVFLDSVQFEKRSWQQRNRIKGPQGAHLLTVPVLTKGVPEQRIADVLIEPGSDFRHRHIQTMRHFYGKAPKFAEVSALLFPLIEHEADHLADYNIHIAMALAAALGIEVKFLRSRDLQVRGTKADLLAAICAEVGAQRYLSAPGSAGYLAESNAFEAAGIEVVYNTFRVAPYAQPHGEFVSHLAVVDALFSLGIAATRELIAAGRHVTPSSAFRSEQSVA